MEMVQAEAGVGCVDLAGAVIAGGVWVGAGVVVEGVCGAVGSEEGIG